MVPLPVSAAVPAAKAFALYLDRLKKEGKPQRGAFSLLIGPTYSLTRIPYSLREWF
jgi:hypothetical protein